MKTLGHAAFMSVCFDFGLKDTECIKNEVQFLRYLRFTIIQPKKYSTAQGALHTGDSCTLYQRQ
jgi:hypothetical protein